VGGGPRNVVSRAPVDSSARASARTTDALGAALDATLAPRSAGFAPRTRGTVVRAAMLLRARWMSAARGSVEREDTTASANPFVSELVRRTSHVENLFARSRLTTISIRRFTYCTTDRNLTDRPTSRNFLGIRESERHPPRHVGRSEIRARDVVDDDGVRRTRALARRRAPRPDVLLRDRASPDRSSRRRRVVELKSSRRRRRSSSHRSPSLVVVPPSLRRRARPRSRTAPPPRRRRRR
jgi:hypothetical protein